MSHLLDLFLLDNLSNQKTATFQLDEVTLSLRKTGKIVVAQTSHHGGNNVTDYSKNIFVSKDFIPYNGSVYLPIASETGSPFLVITSQGEIIIRLNGAIIQQESLGTSFFGIGSYIVN